MSDEHPRSAGAGLRLLLPIAIGVGTFGVAQLGLSLASSRAAGAPAGWATTVGLAASALGLLLLGALLVRQQRASWIAEQQIASLTASEARSRLLIENVPDYALFALDPAGCVTTWNSGAERIHGYTTDEVTGRHCAIFYPAEEVRVGKPARDLAIATERGRIEDEGWRVRKDGTRFWANVIVTALRNPAGELVGFAKIARDVSERKRLEQTLAQARDEALQASQLKSEFLATMSHEVRTPMNGVIGMTGLLMETALTAEQRTMGRVIQNSAESLLAIIDDILDFSKIEAGKLRLVPADFELRQIVEETVALLAPRAHEKRLELVCDFDGALTAPLVGDAGRIRQVLTNLVGNAIKFTERGEVGVSVQHLRDREGRTAFRVAVCDTGVGIPEEARQRLFRPFTQADGTATRRFGGTGLGLAICRQLIELMAGNLGYESVPGQGATFWFELELPRSDAAISEPLAALPAGLRLLAVDDNATNRRILTSQLAHFGLAAETVDNAPAALALMQARASEGMPFHLVLLDWHMPDVSGLQLAAQIRADAGLARTPLVMLSSAGPLDDPMTAASIGFAAFLVKPVRQAQLHRCLARVLASVETLGAVVAATPAVNPAAGEAGLRLLLVEDNLANQMVARMLFEKMGHAVTVANNGREALAQLGQRAFDAVIMDCQMPEMDGYEATRRIRSGKEPGIDPTIPVIAVTAHALPEDRQKCLNAGMDDYVTKPVRAAALREAFLRCGLLRKAGAPPVRVRARTGEGGPPLPSASRNAGLLTSTVASLAKTESAALRPILVVDDSPNDIALLRERLDSAGVRNPIVAFTGSQEAMDFLARTCLEPGTPPAAAPCLVFLDIVMPGMDGLQMLGWLRSREAFKSLRIVMVSSILNPTEIERAYELGADQYLVKYPVADMLAVIVADTLRPDSTGGRPRRPQAENRSAS